MRKVTINKRYLTQYAVNGKLLCDRCCKQLQLGEIIYSTQKRNPKYKGFRHSKSIKRFYCEQCYDEMYLDVSNEGLDEIELTIVE